MTSEVEKIVQESNQVTVGVADYVKTTISSWYGALVKDITSCKSDEEVEAVVAKANATIEAELKVVSAKAKTSEVSTEVSQQIISTTEWAKGIVLEGSAQLKVIGIQVVAGSEGAKDSIAGLVKATEEEVSTAYEKIDSSVTIDVAKAKVAVEHAHKVIKHDAKKPKKHHEHKKAEKKEDHDHTGKVVAGVVAGTVVSVGVAGYVKSTVSSWFDRLKKDITECTEKGGSQADIEAIVSKATAEIDVEFSQVTTKTEESSDKESATKLKETIEWAKGVVTQTTTQVQEVAVQAVNAGTTSAVEIHEKLTGVIESTTSQVDTALDNVKADVTIAVEETKVNDSRHFYLHTLLTF